MYGTYIFQSNPTKTPVMPCDYKIYPKNWKTEIVPAILARAGERRNEAGKIWIDANCEFCGIENHQQGARAFDGRWYNYDEIYSYQPSEIYELFGTEQPKLKTIVLTIAHLDHDATNHDVSYDRLKALCQKCHNNYDKDHRSKNRKASSIKKKGLQELFK